MSNKKTEKLTVDMRRAFNAELKAETLESRNAALEAQIAALQAPPAPAPAAPAAPVVDPREARRAEIRAAADAMPPLEQRAFVLRNHFELMPIADQDVVLAQRGIAPPKGNAA